MRNWYLNECEENGQSKLGKVEFGYSRYENGEKITNHQRLIYRTRTDLQKAFPNPFLVSDNAKSYLGWYQKQFKHGPTVLQEPIWTRVKKKIRTKMTQYKLLKT